MEKEIEFLKKHLEIHQLKLTRQRRAILETFLTMPRHVSAEELYEKSVRKNASIGLATVYRTLHLFTQAGLSQGREFGDGQTRYELTLDHHHHDHLICLGCGKIVEFENNEIENLQEQVAREHAFRIERHKLELYGTCKECRDKRESSLRKKKESK